MNTIMMLLATGAAVAMLLVNTQSAFTGKCRVSTLFVIGVMTAAILALALAALDTFAAVYVTSDSMLIASPALAAAATNASIIFEFSALAAFLATCFAAIVASAKEVRTHMYMSLGFYVCLGASVILFLIAA